MERALGVAGDLEVQVDVGLQVPGDDVPAVQIRLSILACDGQVRLPHAAGEDAPDGREVVVVQQVDDAHGVLLVSGQATLASSATRCQPSSGARRAGLQRAVMPCFGWTKKSACDGGLYGARIANRAYSS